MKKMSPVKEIFETVSVAKKNGRIVGVVPTMGALHEGHLSLVRAAKERCDFVVVTIFVNPTQFAPSEDLDQYPRPLEEDLEKLRQLEVDCVFCPSNEEIYPPGFSTYVDPPDIALPFEGQSRQTHFQGVATVVLKLFQIIPADFAFFGQKDFQQSLVIKKMVTDFNLPVEIIVCPIVREADGLAMSSRNIYLNESERTRSLQINQSLISIANEIQNGNSIEDVVRTARDELGKHVDELEYLEVVDSETLGSPSPECVSLVALVAAKVGKTRLIDNRLIVHPRKET